MLTGNALAQPPDVDAIIASYTAMIEGGKLDQKALADAYLNRGRWYADKKDTDRAIADFTRVIELASDPYGYNERAKIYAATGQKNSAIADYRKMLELLPTSAAAIDGLKKLGVEVPNKPATGGGGSPGGLIPELP
jgi:tetratricopeptide (TPR) repeat protein